MRGIVRNAGLAPFLLGDFVGDVGARERTAIDSKDLADGLGEEADASLAHINSLDARNTTGVREDFSFQLLARLHNELMGQIEDKDGTVLDGILQGRIGVQVGREFDPREVLDVLIGCIDDLGQVLGTLAQRRRRVVVRRGLGDLDFLFKHPHLDLLMEEGRVRGSVFRNDLGDSGAPTAPLVYPILSLARRRTLPVTGAHHGHLVFTLERQN